MQTTKVDKPFEYSQSLLSNHVRKIKIKTNYSNITATQVKNLIKNVKKHVRKCLDCNNRMFKDYLK